MKTIYFISFSLIVISIVLMFVLFMEYILDLNELNKDYENGDLEFYRSSIDKQPPSFNKLMEYTKRKINGIQIKNGDIFILKNDPKNIKIQKNIIHYVTNSNYNHCGIIYIDKKNNIPYILHMTQQKSKRIHELHHYLNNFYKMKKFTKILYIPINKEIPQEIMDKTVENYLSRNDHFYDFSGFLTKGFNIYSEKNQEKYFNCSQYVIEFLKDVGVIKEVKNMDKVWISPIHIASLCVKSENFIFNKEYHYGKIKRFL